MPNAALECNSPAHARGSMDHLISSDISLKLAGMIPNSPQTLNCRMFRLDPGTKRRPTARWFEPWPCLVFRARLSRRPCRATGLRKAYRPFCTTVSGDPGTDWNFRANRHLG